MEGKQWTKAVRRMAVNRKTFAKAEWNNLPARMAWALQRLEDDSLDLEDSVDGATNLSDLDLTRMFKENKDFLKEYLLLNLEKKPGQLSNNMDIVKGVQEYWSQGSQNFSYVQFYEDLFDSLIFKAVKMNSSMALREVLSVAHNSEPPFIKNPRKNHQALIDVCQSGNRKLVKLFLSNGYRLRSTHFDKEKETEYWRDMPFFRKDQHDHENGDEIQNLHILRAMAGSCYILDRFTVVYERLRISQTEESCYCCSLAEIDFRSTPNTNDHHPCPLNDQFLPYSACSKHVECNDPVFRCFEMVKIADKCARNVPEYREEYEEIGAQCSDLAVELLENCKDTNEVETFLNDKVGAQKFFRHEIANKLKYPRLQIAIQNNHRAFVGHMFCQQVLRTQWHGNVPWIRKGFWFKFMYFVIQILLTVPFVVSYLIREIIREAGIDRNSWKSKKLSGGAYDYLTGSCNLDEPLNRFISFTGMYLTFVALLGLSIMCSVTDRDQLLNNFHWYHSCLLIFTVAMMVNDVYILTSVRSLVKAFKFWRTYDLVMHMFLCMAFIARILMGKIHPCFDAECSYDVISQRVPYDTFSNCALSSAAVMCGMRLFYWCQLHDRIGPIVINLSKVIMDLATFTTIFLIMIMSFSIAIVPLKVKNLAIYPGHNSTDHDDPEYDLYNFTVWDYSVVFLETCVALFWSSLNPEEPSQYNTKRMDGVFLHLIYGAYCIACVIVLLNLLIAIMNATIQKVSDSEHLYWKFVRTSIWIEFFGEENGLPMPFTVLLVALHLFKHFVARFKQWRRKESVRVREYCMFIPTNVLHHLIGTISKSNGSSCAKRTQRSSQKTK